MLFLQLWQIFFFIHLNGKCFFFFLVHLDALIQVIVPDKAGIPDLLVQGLCLFRCGEELQSLSIVQDLLPERL